MSSRSMALVALVVSLLALVVSVGMMARRVGEYTQNRSTPLWIFEPLDVRTFSYSGRPVRITDETDPDGHDVVVIDYGGEVLRLRATLPSMPPQVPGLVRHQDWLRVMRFAEHGRGSISEVAQGVISGDIPDRVVAVVKQPLRELEADAPAVAKLPGRRGWKFDFYEFRPEGGFAVQKDLRLPERERDYARRAAAAQRAGRDTPGPLPGTLQAGTWQADAAMIMMPSEPLFSAAYSPGPRQSMGTVRAMGWTMPSAAFSGVAVLLSIVVLTSRRTATSPRQTHPA